VSLRFSTLLTFQPIFSVAYQIFRKVLEPTITTKHQKAERTISTTELALALDVLQGCLLLHYHSKKIVSLTCHALEVGNKKKSYR
jgi:hypothetical protein